eukprot:GHVH01005023.1.p2 GENE.GHVH01005023.1~~GHVH01005023.1.p2  ORF type:complete len:235 (+),score=17.82 GHVH01005023.1:961-1665(+)
MIYGREDTSIEFERLQNDMKQIFRRKTKTRGFKQFKRDLLHNHSISNISASFVITWHPLICGVLLLMTSSTIIFESLGNYNVDPSLMTLSLAAMNVIVTIPTFTLADLDVKCLTGLMISGSLLMAVSMCTFIISFRHDIFYISACCIFFFLAANSALFGPVSLFWMSSALPKHVEYILCPYISTFGHLVAFIMIASILQIRDTLATACILMVVNLFGFLLVLILVKKNVEKQTC